VHAEPSSTPNANNKRPLAVILATSTSPTATSRRELDRKDGEANKRPLKKNSRLSNYFEYDLSKMVNTKGGFLVDEDGGGPGKEVDEEVQRREKLREKERIAKNAEPCKVAFHRSEPFNL
jgi:DNA-repair protein complementing XP-A cells